MEGKTSKKAYHVIQPWAWKLRRNWIIKVLAVMIPLAALLLLAPLIIAKTGLRNYLAKQALPKFTGTLEIGSASLGWFSPVVFQDVKLTDEKGEPLLAIGTLRSENSLLGLASNRTQVGKFHLDGTRVNVVLRDDGSNWEDALPSLMGPSNPQTKPIDFSLELADGAIEITTAATKEKFDLAQLAVQVASGKPGDSPLTVDLAGTLHDPAGKQSRLETKLAWNVPADAAGGLGAGQVTAKSDALPLHLVDAVLRRWCKDLRAGGTANCELAYEWKDNLGAQFVEIRQFAAEGVSVAMPAYLGRDKLETPLLQLGGRLGLVGERLVFDKTSLEAKLGKATLVGSINYRELSTQFVAAITHAVQDEDYQVSGEIDLAELARVLPQTLRLRDDLQVASGQIRVSLMSAKQSQGRAFQGRLDTTNLVAQAGGRRVTWDQPITATASGQQASDGTWSLDANCRANFLSVLAHSQPGQGKLVIDGDLDQLAGQLAQFVNLGSTKMAGKLRADLDIKPTAGQRFELAGTVTAQNFSLTAPGLRPWREDALHLSLAAQGEGTFAGLKQIDNATAQLVSGGDKLDLQLLKPVADVSASTAWPLKLGLAGELGSWSARLQAFLDLSAYDLSGHIDLAGTAVASSDRIQVEKLTANCERLHLHGSGLLVDEQIVKIESTGTLDLAKSHFSSPVTTLASSALAFRADSIEANFQPGKLSLSGDVVYRGDLARITSWTADPRTPSTQQLFGALEGSAKLVYADGATQAQLQSTIENLTLAQRGMPAAQPRGPQSVAIAPTAVASTAQWQTIWQEPKVSISGKAKYTGASDAAEIETLTVDSSSLRVAMQGQLASLTKQLRLDVTGQLDYDWQNVMQRLGPVLGPNVQFSGHESRAFKIKGPLWVAASSATSPPTPAVAVSSATPAGSTAALTFPPDLAAEAGLGWSAANVYGQTLGKGEVLGKLEKGVVRFSQLEFPAGNGKLRLAPWLDLNATPYLLRHEQATVVENVQITPELCQSWLKYMAPLMADATKAQGLFSVQLQNASVPLANPYAADIAGTLAIQQAQVGPGPMSESFIAIGQQIKALLDKKPLGTVGSTAGTWINVPPQNIALRVVQGRVYHEKIQMQVKDVVISSTGSVGLDQTVAMVAEVPIRDEWIANNRFLAGLRGQSLKIPIGGTLAAPQLDWRAVTDLGRQAAGGAAQGLIEDGLKKGLNKFLPQ